VGKDGEVLAVEAGGPAATVEVVRKLVEAQGGETAAEGEEKEAETEKMAETAAEVADVAEDLDGTPAAA
jgi:peroxiredoxin Q/BCP